MFPIRGAAADCGSVRPALLSAVVSYSVLAFAAGCEQVERPANGSPAVFRGAGTIQVVTTCGMVTDIVQRVGGNRTDVGGMMGEDVDPHTFKPTRSDVKRLMEADAVFYSGLLLEGRFGDTFTRVARSGKPVHAVTEALDESYLREPEDLDGHVDPHVWMDVAAWTRCMLHVSEVLAAFDPPHAEEYRSRAKEYRTELDALDRYARECIATIPAEQRVLVTAHDAFGYFARAYGIEVLSVQGISTESEAGVEDVNRLVQALVSRKIPALFVESSVNPKNIRAVVEGAAARGTTVRIGGQLYSDAMGPAGTYEGTYVGMIDHDVTTITRALGGKAPERGLNGKLAVPAATDK